MTREELEKEAIKYAVDYSTSYGKGYKHKDLRIAYLAGAEPREKQIEIDAEQIRALQKQNGELADELTLTNNECKDMREELKQRIRENQKLCEQIEKMKCCGNCIHCKYDENEDSYEYCEKHQQVVNIAVVPCSEWKGNIALDYITELEKENAELKTRVSEQSERISELTQELDDKINRFE